MVGGAFPRGGSSRGEEGALARVNSTGKDLTARNACREFRVALRKPQTTQGLECQAEGQTLSLNHGSSKRCPSREHKLHIPGRPNLPTPWPLYPHSTGGETEAQRGGRPGNRLNPLACPPPRPAEHTFAHAPVCAPGNQRSPNPRGGWRGQAWLGSWRLDSGSARSRVCRRALGPAWTPQPSPGAGSGVDPLPSCTPLCPTQCLGAPHYCSMPHSRQGLPQFRAAAPTPYLCLGSPVPPPSSGEGCNAARSSQRPPAPCGPQFPRGPMQPCSHSGFHRGPTLCLGAPHLTEPPDRPGTRTNADLPGRGRHRCCRGRRHAEPSQTRGSTAAAVAAAAGSPPPPPPMFRTVGPAPGGNGRAYSGREGAMRPRQSLGTRECFRKEPNVLPRDWRVTGVGVGRPEIADHFRKQPNIIGSEE